jgi:hypothetical protein
MVTSGQNWDCSIVLCPKMYASSLADIVHKDPSGNLTNITGNNGCLYGGLVVAAGPQGSDLWPTVANAGNQPSTQQSLDAHDYISGNARVIGMGFEVVNTTSALNRQGQCTSYRMPTQWTLDTINNAGTTTVPLILPMQVNRCPPANLAAATLLAGSRTWAAEEGAYVVARQNGIENPLGQPSHFVNSLFVSDQTIGLSTTLQTNITYASNGLWSGPTFSDIWLPYDTSGIHLTGLSYTTTLTVNVRWLIERMPSYVETDLVVLATPSANYDPLALELYTKCMADMPPGVMLKENPLGEWFRSALSKVADWAPKIGGALSTVIPGAGLIGNVVGGAAGKIRNFIPVQPTLAPVPASPAAVRQVGPPLPPRNTTVSGRNVRRKRRPKQPQQ